MKIEVKICGLTRREDVELAVRLGADYLGFVIYAGSRRHVPPEKLAELTRGLPPCVRNVVQLHGRESADFARSIDFAAVWKATYDPDFPAERLVCDAPRGGSGQLGDHEKAAAIARIRPVMLAGGITPDNAGEFIRRVRPAGIDLAGGVESAPGIKDEEKMKRLFHNLKGLEP